jgi:hypothetical protein
MRKGNNGIVLTGTMIVAGNSETKRQQQVRRLWCAESTMGTQTSPLYTLFLSHTPHHLLHLDNTKY